MQRLIHYTLIVFMAVTCYGQAGNTLMRRFTGVPTGVCNFTMMAIDTATGNLYDCPVASWVLIGTSGGGVPSGSLMLITSGTCSAGWTEATDLDGMTVIGTLAANANVGTTGGADTITPSGSVSAPAFTGSSATTSAVSAGTPAGTNSAPALTMDSYTPAGANGAITMSGATAAEAAHTHSVTAAGTNGTVTITPLGSNSAPAFTGTAGTVPAETISYPANVPVFTGNSTTVPAETVNSLTAAAQSISGSTAAEASHTHSVTATGTNTSGAFAEGAISWPTAPTNVPTNSGGAFAEGAISWPAGVPTAAGDAATSATGSSGGARPTATHTHTISWPAGVPTIAAGVFTQPVIAWPAKVPTIAAGVFTQPTFTGNAVTSGAGSSHLHAVGTLVNATSEVTGTLNSTTLTPLGTVAWPVNPPTNSTVSFTPAGTVAAPTFTGSSTTVGAETFTGSAVTSGAGSSHLHAIGTIAASTPSFSGTPATLTGSVAAPTFTGAALGTHTHTVTATGTNSAPVFTGTSFDNRSAFIRAIFCRKN